MSYRKLMQRHAELSEHLANLLNDPDVSQDDIYDVEDAIFEIEQEMEEAENEYQY